jgi:hypothetical protein
MVKHLVSINTLWQTARQFTIHWGFLGIYKSQCGDTVSKKQCEAMFLTYIKICDKESPHNVFNHDQ